MPSTQDVRVKGSPVRSLRKFLDIELSESQRERVFANVPDEYRKKITSGNILATDVFPVAVLNEIVISAANLKNEAVPSFARRAGRHAAEQAAGSVLKFFMLLMTASARKSDANLLIDLRPRPLLRRASGGSRRHASPRGFSIHTGRLRANQRMDRADRRDDGGEGRASRSHEVRREDGLAVRVESRVALTLPVA